MIHALEILPDEHSIALPFHHVQQQLDTRPFPANETPVSAGSNELVRHAMDSFSPHTPVVLDESWLEMPV